MFLFLLLTWGIMNANAQYTLQPNSEKTTLDSLTTALNKLQRDFAYLDCYNKLKICTLEIDVFNKGLDISSNSILINIYNTGFDQDLYDAYQENYNVSLEWYEAKRKAVSDVKTLATLMLFTKNFTEVESDIINNLCNLLDTSLEKTKAGLRFYSVVLKNYKDKY